MIKEESVSKKKSADRSKYLTDDKHIYGCRQLPDWADRFESRKTVYTGVGRCYEKHPALKLPGTEHVIYGGSCSHPVVDDADVYIGFDLSMSFTPRHWPWKKGTEVKFEISDMRVPTSVKDFRKLVEWAKEQIDAGKKVHAGCIGGHGRTGMFFAALVSLYGEKDAITYVRENYCKKAVESKEQVDFLVREFGITKVAGSKSGISTGSSKSYSTHASSTSGSIVSMPAANRHRTGSMTFNPLASEPGIWG